MPFSTDLSMAIHEASLVLAVLSKASEGA
jgi:hypothetical protein